MTDHFICVLAFFMDCLMCSPTLPGLRETEMSIGQCLAHFPWVF